MLMSRRNVTRMGASACYGHTKISGSGWCTDPLDNYGIGPHKNKKLRALQRRRAKRREENSWRRETKED